MIFVNLRLTILDLRLGRVRIGRTAEPRSAILGFRLALVRIGLFEYNTAISCEKTVSSFHDGAFFVIQEESPKHPLRGAPVHLACVDSS